jgi:hypothetical protein
MNAVTHLDINDYLDLYLYARNIDDILWQNEIIEKLQNLLNGSSLKNQSLDSDTLWEKYKYINKEILTLYHQLRDHSINDDLQEKILNLKQQRISLGRQIGLAKRNSF